jgi:hypothetical protein
MKYDEFVRWGGRDGEIEKPEQDGAVLINGCPVADLTEAEVNTAIGKIVVAGYGCVASG